MPDPITLSAIVLSAIGAGCVTYGMYNTVRRLWYKARMRADTRRMERAQMQYAKQQMAKNDYELTIAARDETIKAYQDVLAKQKAKIEDLTDEVFRLHKRNILMSNEMRTDHKAPTEVLPASSGRFARGL